MADRSRVERRGGKGRKLGQDAAVNVARIRDGLKGRLASCLVVAAAPKPREGEVAWIDEALALDIHEEARPVEEIGPQQRASNVCEEELARVLPRTDGNV